MGLSKIAEICRSCPKVDTCNHKRMEMCALAELPERAQADMAQTASVSAAMLFMRERIESPLSPFEYKDELEKALNEAHFGDRFMMFGA